MILEMGMYTFSSQFVCSRIGKSLTKLLFKDASNRSLGKMGKPVGTSVVATISYGTDTIDFLQGKIPVN